MPKTTASVALLALLFTLSASAQKLEVREVGGNEFTGPTTTLEGTGSNDNIALFIACHYLPPPDPLYLVSIGIVGESPLDFPDSGSFHIRFDDGQVEKLSGAKAGALFLQSPGDQGFVKKLAAHSQLRIRALGYVDGNIENVIDTYDISEITAETIRHMNCPERSE